MTHKRHLPLSAALLAALSWNIPAQASTPVASDVVSAMPDGYAERGTLMEHYLNPLGTIDQLRRFQTLTGIESRMMLAKAYYEMGDERSVPLLEDFIAAHPSDPQTINARMLLGDWWFFNGEWARALEVYEKIEPQTLGGTDMAAYTYRTAFSLIKTGYYDRAVPMLTRLLRSHSYAPAAQFYLAYTEYMDGNYDAAYEGFQKAADMAAENYGDMQGAARRSMPRRTAYIPTGLEAGYYLTQIDFRRGDYRAVTEHVPMMLERCPVPELIPEMRRIAGESWFKLGDMDQAASYLSDYLDDTEVTHAPSAVYAMGVIDYNEGDWEKAAERFGTLTDLDNDLAQSAYLYIGQCAIQSDNNDLAAIAFRNAYRMNYDAAVAETALYNYIAAITRGGSVPFTSSIPLMREFVEKYPESRFAPAVEQYMAVAYYNEKDYDNALESINRIVRPDAEVLAAKQKILFELGVRELSNDRPAAAVRYLQEGTTLSRFNSEIGAQTALWLADAQYALGKYADAQQAYSDYLSQDSDDDNTSLAIYNRAYSLYMQDKFAEALTDFDEALKAKPALPKAQAADAMMRKADCLYYLGHLQSASEQYAKTITDGSADADYAAMRRAVIAGVDGDNTAKVNMLAEMMRDYPASKWLSTAMLEQALAYAELGNTKKAIDTFDALAHRWPDSPETRNALLQMALLYNKNGDSDEAIDTYRRIIEQWPTSHEATLAGDDLRLLYASRGELSQLASFLKSVPGAPQLDDDEVEQLTFEAAAQAYAAGGDDSKLQEYLRQWPDGRYVAQALRDIAEYQYEDLNNPTAAIATIDRLIELRPDAQQVPGALMLKGEILERVDPDESEKIVDIYREVEKRGGSAYAVYAWAGIMRNTTSARERIEYARRVREAGGVTAEDADEARYYEALGMLENAATSSQAAEQLQQLAAAPLSAAGSKAAVTLAEYYLDTRQYQKAVELLQKFTDSGTEHEYWLARGYISLADAYRAQGKKQLATEYIRSLKENYPGDEADIAEMIDKRLKQWK